MLSRTDLTSLARARLGDAKKLQAAGRHDGAAYLCGYSVEIALKARIARTLHWKGFPETEAEFRGLTSLKTHNLQILLQLSGWEDNIKHRFPSDWWNLEDWNPELRYTRPGTVNESDANLMIESATRIVRALL